MMEKLAWAAPIFGSYAAVVMTGTSKPLPRVVAVCVATLAIKSLVVALLTVRARMIGGETAFASKQEAKNLLFIVFKPVLLAYEWAPALGGIEAAARLERCKNNNCEFEPILAGLMLAASEIAKVGITDKKGNVVQADQAELVKTLCMVATLGRVMHTIFFMTLPLTGPEPRTLAFDGFFFASLGLAVYLAIIAA